MKKLTYILFSVLIISITACGTTEFYPKPVGHNHIDLPEHKYQVTDAKYPYSFEYSSYATLVDDTLGFHDDYWIKIHYPDLNFSINFTYYPIKDNLKTLMNDAYKLANQHDVKAYSIEPESMINKDGNPVTCFKLEGEVASTYQFFTHDSTNHFLRGALYYPDATKNDSLQPVSDYVIQDIKHLLHTLKWK
ncbi:MAG: gliding motility lipoprotein GldD [Cytophagales bacterium]|nr:gliding motility lipoprotein GldD [Cytophagales bacterium]